MSINMSAVFARAPLDQFLLLLLLLLSLGGRRAGIALVLSAPAPAGHRDMSWSSNDAVGDIKTTHFSYEEMANLMTEVSKTFPHITRLYSIGKSVAKRDLLVMEISDNPGVHEPGEPEFKYVGNIHGNEVTGKDTLLYLMQYLCQNYGLDEGVTQLIDSTRLHFFPSMNPDGYSHAYEGDRQGVTGRRNANSVDLNRNFPDRYASAKQTGKIQPETAAVIQWLKDYPFVLSASLHNGALVANYPYDNSKTGLSVYTATNDDDIFIQLSLAYSNAHPTMHLGKPCAGDIEGFERGITNGADWYTLNGGMQDFNYLRGGCMEVTIEQNCQKFPEEPKMGKIWVDNKAALIAYIHEVHKGVKGFISDESGNPVPGATVSVNGRDHTVSTAEFGDYWRLLVPGDYVLEASAESYESSSLKVTIAEGPATVLNFTLSSLAAATAQELEQPQPTSPPGPTPPAASSSTATASTSSGATTMPASGESEVSNSTGVTAGTEASNASTAPMEGTTETLPDSRYRNSTEQGGNHSIIDASTPTANDSSSANSTVEGKGSLAGVKDENFPVAIGVTLVALIFGLVCAIVIISMVIGYNLLKTKHVRKGFAPVPMEENQDDDIDGETVGRFDYGSVIPPPKSKLTEAPAYNDNPPAFLPVESINKGYSSSEEDEVVYSATNGTES